VDQAAPAGGGAEPVIGLVVGGQVAGRHHGRTRAGSAEGDAVVEVEQSGGGQDGGGVKVSDGQPGRLQAVCGVGGGLGGRSAVEQRQQAAGLGVEASRSRRLGARRARSGRVGG